MYTNGVSCPSIPSVFFYPRVHHFVKRGRKRKDNTGASADNETKS